VVLLTKLSHLNISSIVSKKEKAKKHFFCWGFSPKDRDLYPFRNALYSIVLYDLAMTPPPFFLSLAQNKIFAK